jgi:hypothetical protein
MKRRSNARGVKLPNNLIFLRGLNEEILERQGMRIQFWFQTSGEDSLDTKA